jgi:hypothetical protein
MARSDNAYPQTPGHRGESTSIEAGDAIAGTTGRLRQLALSLIREAGPHGLTALETCSRAGVDRVAMQPRLSELRKMGLIADSGMRRVNPSGIRAKVWIAVEVADNSPHASASPRRSSAPLSFPHSPPSGQPPYHAGEMAHG